MTTQLNQKILYDTDFLAWLETTAHLLKTRQLDQIDYDNLIEEIEAMGRSEKTALTSNLRILLMHLLKWKYESSRQSNSWRFTIREHRKRIQQAFLDSPSLKRHFEQVFDVAYKDGRELAADETGMPIDTFPLVCPFTIEQVLDSDYLPE
jgi:hypothetical protein